MRVTCAVCKKNTKIYVDVGIPPNDNTSWVCGHCYNSTKKRITNLKGTVGKLNSIIARLRNELNDTPDFLNRSGFFG